MPTPKKVAQEIEELEYEEGAEVSDEGSVEEYYNEELQTAIKRIKEARTPLDLYLYNNDIGDAGVKLLAEAIKVAQVPLDLGLSKNGIGEAGIKFLAEAIKVARAPLDLDLSNNAIGDAGAGFLAEAMKLARFLLSLNLSSNTIGKVGTRLLIEAVKKVRLPFSLDLCGNYVGDDGAALVAKAIREVRFHPVQDFCDNYVIEEVCTKRLAELIEEMQLSLTLGLNKAGITAAGAKFLAEAIKETPVQINCGLSDNNIGDDGAGFLAEAIKVARFKLNLSLCNNNISEAGAKFLAEAIKVARVPLSLDLNRNCIGDAAVKPLAEAIKEARFKLSLGLHEAGIEEAGAKLLAEAMKVAQVPITLKLSYNNIGEAGAGFLAESIKEARVPITLNLYAGILGEAGARLLYEAKEDNFILDAAANPLKFLSLIKSSPSTRMLEQELGFPYVLVKLVQGYIGNEDLAWFEVAAIRAVEGASNENKYSSINYELLNAAHSIAPISAADGKGMVDDAQDASLQSQVLNLLLLISRIKALSNRLEIPQGYVDVPGDGLCFYHAISRQLGSPGHSALELQQMAIDEIINHLDRYEGFAAQYGGGLNGFLNYHLQRQDSEKGGWADNIMIQALANALERVIEVQLFDRAGNAIGAGPVVINPYHIADPNILRLGNLDDLHFVAATSASDDGEEEVDWDQYRCEIQDADSVPTPAPTTAPTMISETAPAPNATSQAYYETLEIGGVSSFEFIAALMLSGMDSVMNPS